ncbi:hypothetical protein [Sphingobacterium psychroaquaticum]|uniref:GAF domain-containing protein n=1 Tax=Sphingobacterium psychroaquaticum TaxID=561061 RepID=A0A1X7JPM2_9SPHI|nr:hypothetical protein [Sphingobacterium psychroaquaticum]SMG29897.1 hypothetical protein SAMN05660862_1988 [Sphingobacterium psychroaquaticum]
MLIKSVAINSNIKETLGLEQRLSLMPFQRFLLKNIADPVQQSNIIPKLVMEYLEGVLMERGEPTPENLSEFTDVFGLIHRLTNSITNLDDRFWGLAFPVPDKAFFGRDTFYDLLDSDLTLLPDSGGAPFYPDIAFTNKLLYILVLERFYGIKGVDSNMRYVYFKHGVPQYVELKVDFSFVEVALKGELPRLDFSCLRDKNVEGFDDIEPLLSSINLEAFSFTGISILRFVDCNREQVFNKVQQIVADLSRFEKQSFHRDVSSILSTMVGTTAISHSFFPVLELNGFPILKSDLVKDSIFFGELILKEREKCQSGIFDYLKAPYTISYGVETGMDSFDETLIAHLKQLKLASYVCFPLRHNGDLVGFLELYSRDLKFDNEKVVSIAPYMPMLTLLAYELAVGFKAKLNQVILQNFTSLQEAVQWRFNQVAAHYLLEPKLEKILFENVYPLYGAVDIKNSTLLRNLAYKKDSLYRINQLDQILRTIPVHRATEQQFMMRLEHITQWLNEGYIDKYLVDILSFFQEEVPVFMDNLPLDNAEIQELRDMYREGEDIVRGKNNRFAMAFEQSLSTLNQMINKELTTFNQYIQDRYPSYFEKFRTDGVEYDAYVGQSITPAKVFNVELLREFRKQQVISMAEIGQQAHAIIDDLPIALETTQLIFIHPNPIAISFRQDERRFDVEGGYNIRYQMIKKRIDKALIKDTKERLVQPGCIALVYATRRVEEELKGILKEVHEMGLIGANIESLVLEELQGLNELRALRVRIAGFGQTALFR